MADTATKEQTQTPAAGTTTNTALATRPATALARPTDLVGEAMRGLIPGSYGEAMDLARFLVKSEVVPKALQPKAMKDKDGRLLALTPADVEQKAATCFTVILAGLEYGLTPMRALKALSIIGGTLAVAADLQLATVRAKGLLAYHDEGWEVHGVSDGDLVERSTAGLDERAAGLARAIAGKVLALVARVESGRHYGWCAMRRKGDDSPATVRVFTQDDADRVTFTDWVDDENRAKKTDGSFHRKRIQKPMSQKDNYRNWPQDMYPKRARVRVLGVLFYDAIGGLPTQETLDGVVVDGHVVDAEPLTESDGPQSMDVDDYLAQLDQDAPDQAKAIRQGFEHLHLNHAKRLQLLVQYRETPAALAEWLRGEVEQRRGVPPEHRKHPKAGPKATAATEPEKPADLSTGPVAETKPAEPEPATPAVETKPADPEPVAKAVTALADLLARPLPPGAVRRRPSDGRPVNDKGRLVKDYTDAEAEAARAANGGLLVGPRSMPPAAAAFGSQFEAAAQEPERREPLDLTKPVEPTPNPEPRTTNPEPAKAGLRGADAFKSLKGSF